MASHPITSFPESPSLSPGKPVVAERPAPASPASSSAGADRGEPATTAGSAEPLKAAETVAPVEAVEAVEAVGAVEAVEAPEPTPLLLQMPVDIRSMPLMVITILASLFVLHWAKAVLVPVMLGVLFSYALSPIVNWLESRRIPRWASSAVLLVAMFGGMGSAAWTLSGRAVELAQALPSAAAKIAQAIKKKSGATPSPLDTVQKAAAQIEQAARGDPAAPAVRGVQRVVVEAKAFDIKDHLWSGSIGLAALVGQAIVVVFLTYFLMLSGDTFRRKMIKLAGPNLSRKKITLQALHEVTDQIQRYLQVQVLTSVVVGLLTWAALAAIGLENALIWGVVAGAMNFIPYVGTVITAGASGMFGFLQFGTPDMALLVGGASLVIHALTGNLMTPWLTSKTSRLSPVAVFVGMLAWGWLWGVWGLLLGIPILMMVKAVCDRVEDLKPIGEFLGS
ncbi:MAG: AI-2E family transporter [Polaromonas sp.]|nr:AI-2E family transporter [Polaromonas sp.]